MSSLTLRVGVLKALPVSPIRVRLHVFVVSPWSPVYGKNFLPDFSENSCRLPCFPYSPPASATAGLSLKFCEEAGVG